MAWTIKITGSAKEDIRAIKNWYRKKSIQALSHFTSELAETIERLRREDVEHKPVYGTYRRGLLRNFPYGIFYQRIEENHVVEISAVFHNHRDADAVSERLT